ncbi:MAG: 30S ribosomal protein THX [Bacteroidia bacterium]
MGRGDIKSKKGKISNGSYGVRRKRKQAKKFVAGAVKAKPATTLFPDEEVKKTAKKAAPKKAAKAEGEEAPKKKAAPKKKKTEE